MTKRVKLRNVITDTRGFYYITSKVNGVEENFMLDTGASSTVMSAEFIPEGAEVIERVEIAMIGKSIAGIKVNKPLLLDIRGEVIEIEPYFVDFTVFVENKNLKGLLGFNFFRNFVGEISFREDYLLIKGRNEK